ncbi:ABC transporter ATP-binding protein [Clostridia bacterium]|nr:ABC transporter ATP-binding protein [Clostridia bacterium]
METKMNPLMESSPAPLLALENLTTAFASARGRSVTVVENVSFQVASGEIVGLVGESGCGKSVTSLSIMRLFQNTSGRVTGGSVRLRGIDLLKLSPGEMRRIRGPQVAMVFQEPMSSLNPSMRVRTQLQEAIRLHTNRSTRAADAHALDMLRQVGLPNPKLTAQSYPHQLSGGISQRVMIAMAMSCDPQLLIADEPTTALDVTIQAQILDLMRRIREEHQTGIILITHDLGIVAEMCDRVLVMYAGRIVEEAPVRALFKSPLHPYTQGLIASVPKLRSGLKQLPYIPGRVPDVSAMPIGCKFAPRCKYAQLRCREEEPGLEQLDTGHACRCYYPLTAPLKS